MLQQILRDMYIDPEILAELSDEQKEILFCKMREEQIRKWKINDEEYEKKMKKTKKKKKKGGKTVEWLLGRDSKEWVWVMGDHDSDKQIEDILVKERQLKANQLAHQEAEAKRAKEEEGRKKRAEEERNLREEQARLAAEKAVLESARLEEERILREKEAAEKVLKERLAKEQAEEQERKKKVEEEEQKLQEMKAKWQKAAAEEKKRLADEEERRQKEVEQKRLLEVERQKELAKRKAEQEALKASMEAARKKKERLEEEKKKKEQIELELLHKAERLKKQREKDIKAKEERDKKLKEEEKHRAEELYVVLKKTDENKMKMAETDRANIEEFWKVQLRRSKNADNERRQRARWAREEVRRSRLSGNFENLTLDEIYNEGMKGDSQQQPPPIRPASGMPRPSQPVSKDDVICWYRENQEPKQAGIRVDFNGKKPCKWFHGIIPRQKAEEILEGKKPGSFLVRVSEKVWGYVLSYRDVEAIKHFLIDASGSTYQFFGADPSKQHSVHNRLGDLITYHKVIPVSERGREVLKDPVGQEGPIPDYKELFEDKA
ncbi:SH2 domain-containing protein 4B-like [Asterias rubens]|uniref:SH2 domain-containing protein 4B-like n=1 Tax=Asterias rubens TaxID=7604 RepID=UPI0014553146|nr:SH2 domain-containing protein 4B-like [Asterias rubens]XP_033644209.1 SH2 domain-containing protein 4B-like [Asterias rubens]XP_033644211.1 SH2 domain-containing protein 4B-like [Asterias rubens]XP_033644212.1 SH2 domain-containing protein 4B-like [Asterias rubens]XP_033644213.1 SH2 domain-containing protein 4B-like [Asterias rubens]XP_033644214.1 SH2 domain-containing protein 4B-like [Asterias rubens]